VSGSGLLGLDAVVQHGPWLATLVSLAVTPVGYAAIAAALERRLLRLRSEFVALLFGDPLLAVSIGLGAWLLDGRDPTGVAGTQYSLASSLFWLGFGLLQWITDLRASFYTRSQIFAPTKIWHQVVVYPLLGYWTWAACMGGLMTPDTGPAPAFQVAAKAGIVGGVVLWMLANVYDRRHPKLGHPPYSWRKLRPQPAPWPPTSISLRAYLARR